MTRQQSANMSFIVYRCSIASTVQYSENRIRSNYLPVKFIKTTCQYFWTAIMLAPENSSVAGTEQRADNSALFDKLKRWVKIISIKLLKHV